MNLFIFNQNNNIIRKEYIFLSVYYDIIIMYRNRKALMKLS